MSHASTLFRSLFLSFAAFSMFLFAPSLVGAAPILLIGSGTQEDPYLISFCGNLEYIAANEETLYAETNYYELTDNLDCTLYGNDIMLGATQNFHGVFNGMGHMILVDFEDTAAMTFGLFRTTTSAVIQNLEVGGFVTLTDGEYVGGVVGFLTNNSSLLNVKSSVLMNVGDADMVGGLVGSSSADSYMDNLHFTGDITGDTMVGGIVGYLSSGFVRYSFSDGVVAGNESVGGLAGRADAGTEITYSVNKSVLDSLGVYVAPLVGDFRLGFEPSIVVATEFMEGNVIAHQAGMGYDNPSCLIYEDALETPQAFYSPCTMVDVTVDESYFYDFSNAPYTNGSDNWNNDVYDDWYFTGSALPTLSAFRDFGTFSGTGAGTEGDPYIITSCAQFQEIHADMSASYQIQVMPEEGEDMAYLNCSAEGNDMMIRHPLRDFSGSLNGGGVVLRIDIDSNNKDNIGLFAHLDGATIQNMYLTGTLDSLGGNYVGALAGAARSSEIYFVFADVTVNSDGNYVGGMVGDIFDLSNAEAISGTGAVNGGEYVGALFGQMVETRVAQVIANAPVNGATSVGGFAGTVTNSELIEISSMGDVNFAYPLGMDNEDYTDEGAFMGGVTGESFYSTFNDVKVIATVTGDYALGSVSGIMDADSSITNAYLDTVLTYNTELEVEEIPAVNTVGPVIGLDVSEGVLQSELPTVMEAYYAEDTYTGLTSTLGTALSAGQMEDVMSFEGFDFQDIWGFDAEVTADRAYLSFEYPGGVEYIQDCDGLDAIREALDSTYIILNNIDCSAYKTNVFGFEDSGLGFEPIGSLMSPFTGDLMSYGDQQFEISGLYINSSNSYSGLFGSIENGSVQGLELVGAYENDELLVAQASFSGALAGSIEDTYVSNITSSMALSLTSNEDNLVAVGGLIGRVGAGSTINDVEIVPDATSDILAGDTRFEGQNPVMVYIDNPDYSVQGSGGVLGQVCQEGGECSISNVTMEASTFVRGQDVYRVGGLIGALFTNDGGTSRLWAPEGSTLVVDAEAPEQIGTLVGRLENTEMLESSSEMKFYVRAGDSTAGDIGGLVGSGSDIAMEDVFYDGIFEVDFDTVLAYTAEAFGGLIGDASGVYLQNTYAAGEMTLLNPGGGVTRSAVGGLIGQAFITEGDRINSSFVEMEMDIDAPSNEKHILLGRGLYDIEETWGLDEFLRDNYYNGVNLSGSGLECAPGLTEEMEYSGEDLMCAAQWGGPSVFHANNEHGPLPNWDFSSVWRLYPVGAPRLRALYRPAEPSPFEGEGTEEDPKIISNCGQFALMDDDIFAAGDVYQFTDSLDCAGWDLELSFQEHPFTGVLDGTTNTIYNMEMSGFFTDVALFAQTDGAVFRNINFEDADVYTNLGSASVLVKEATDTSFENIDFDTVSVDGWDEVGVLASHVDGGTFEDITMNDAFVEGDFNVGTIFGLGEGAVVNMSEILIRNSSVNLDDEGLGENVGGLVGRFEGESLIGNTIAYEGNVYGTTYVGGLGGLMYNMDITHAYFDGVVFEQLEADGSYFGGLFGYAENSDMQKMYSHGTLDLGGSNLGAMIIGAMDGGTLTDTVGNMEVANAFTDTRGVVSFTRNGAVLSGNYFTNNNGLDVECYDEGDVEEACDAIDSSQEYFYNYMVADPLTRFDTDVWHPVHGGMPRFNRFAELPYNLEYNVVEGAKILSWTLPEGFSYDSHILRMSTTTYPENITDGTLVANLSDGDTSFDLGEIADGFYYFSLFTRGNDMVMSDPLRFAFYIDTTSPTGEFFSPDVEDGGTTSLDSIEFALTFNENVHDITHEVFMIDNATVTEGDYVTLYSQYFFVLEPTEAGEVVVSLPEGTFEDESGNPTPALNYIFTYAPEEEEEEDDDDDDDTPRGGGGGGGGKSRSSNSRTNEAKTSETESSEESTETLSENIFGDMEGHFAKEYVKNLFKQGVVQGRSEGKYEPDAEMNRAELAKIAVKMFFPEATPNLEVLKKFSDVDATAWYAPFMAVLVQEGVLQGYADGTLKPEESVNRAEALKMLMAAADLKLVQENPEWSFGDVPTGSWFEPFVKTAYQLGIVQGKSPRRFAPELPVTRGEMAKMAVLSQNAKLKP